MFGYIVFLTKFDLFMKNLFQETVREAYQAYKICNPMGLRNTVMNQINELNK